MKEVSILFYTQNYVVRRTVTDFLRDNNYSLLKIISTKKNLLHYVTEHKFSIAIIDMDGLTVSELEVIKRSQKDLRMIVISSSITKQFALEIQRMKIDSLVVKPFTYKTLEEKIKQIIR